MKVTLQNLTKKFPSRNKKQPVDVIAVNDFTFEIPDGVLLGLLGPSGCGKSTTLNLLSGLQKPTSGRIFFGDDDVTDLPAENRGVGLVFQNYALYPHLTVRQNITFPLENRTGKDKLTRQQMADMALEAAKLVQIEELMDRRPKELSGGQQQRVAIARALVKMPKILLLDEPLSNLDARLRLQTREEIRRIQKATGITTVFVTHDQEEALTLSDRIAVFNKGIIEQIGTPNEVYNHSQTEFVCNFIGDINRLNDDTVSALRAAGAEVDASKHNYIRLERLHVNVAPRGGEIALDGTVESCEYYGLYIKYYIHVGTQSLKVIEKNDGVNIYDPGQRVKVILNPNDIMAYAPSAEEVE